MQLDGTTKLLGIFGDPIAHSLSPRMQNAAIEASAINAVYVPFHVSAENLGHAVAAIRTFNMVGVNVTVPHKEGVIPFLDEIDPAASMIGAVNTIVNRDGILVGYNTDAIGFLDSLRTELSFTPAGKNVVLLGAGGAARAAVVALSQAGARYITICNRTFKKAEGLRNEFSGQFPQTGFAVEPLEAEKMNPSLSHADLLVNTTAVGLHGESFSLPLIEELPSGAVLYDMVYNAGLTPLQQAAADRGVPFADGRGMLAGQGEEAFRLWFNIRPAPGIMRSVIAK